MRVAVLGGAGYIGSHVVLALRDAGHETVVFDDLSTGQQSNVDATGAPFVKGDVRSATDLDRLFNSHDIDAVIHLAAKKAVGESMERPELYAEHNIGGSIQVLAAMHRHGVRDIVFSSSAAVYGEPQQLPITEEHPLRPESVYGYTKKTVEELLDWHGRLKHVRYAALRYFNAVGFDPDGRLTTPEKDPQNLLPILFEAADGQRDGVTIFGDDYDTPDGTCLRDYIHVTDLADAHVKALQHLGDKGLILNLGTGKALSVRECVDAVQRIHDFPVTVGPRRRGDPAVVYADATRARTVLGWTPTHSDLPTIVETMARVHKA